LHAVLATLKSHARLARAAFLAPSGQVTDAAQRHEVSLGATRVQIRVEQAGTGGPCFINVHENESTSVSAARALMRTRPARLITLHAQGARLIGFRIGWRAHTLDPNRIFTEHGLAATLQALGPDTVPARQAGALLRDALLALLPPPDGGPIVALHNNEGGAYSIESYLAGGVHAGDAVRVQVGDRSAPHDFFIVTQAPAFDRLAADGFNIVQQSPDCADDGSLSVWAQRHARAYVNVEALDGHLDSQQRMLEAVARHVAA
jgi:hypothetical protein